MRDSCGISGTGETPNGAKRKEAHRTPRGKRATWSGNQLLPKQQRLRKQLINNNFTYKRMKENV
ncbi:hypothetical protein ABE41_016350 [Fictibacillus arsenicus]|uniref:Uncharacterized protein n=1 Tax=Fictibacillus arsenicus TaxID=255247 RepID=A0A1B1Z7Y5_9BACL|nr:hypothetical protein ABE41_016350 [Fictibacillus arsenicus]